MFEKFRWNWMVGWECTALCCKVRPFQRKPGFIYENQVIWKGLQIWRPLEDAGIHIYIYTYIHIYIYTIQSLAMNVHLVYLVSPWCCCFSCCLITPQNDRCLSPQVSKVAVRLADLRPALPAVAQDLMGWQWRGAVGILINVEYWQIDDITWIAGYNQW